MKVPFVDLKLEIKVRQEIIKALTNVVDSKKYIGGKELEKFEKNFSEYIGTRYCIGVNSGSDALFLSLTALGIKKGDEVITVANSFISTADAIMRTGATPVFVDVDEKTLNIDVKKIEKKINKKTKAIVPVHLYGNPADIGNILKLAKNHKLKIVEDVAQAIDATFEKIRVGQFGNLGCFSFYPSKNLGAMGDAGAVVTNSPDLYIKIKALKNYGQIEKNVYKYVGINSRLDEFQAAVLNVKLKYLSETMLKRKKKVELYKKLLPQQNLQIVSPLENSSADYHLLIVRVKKRNHLQKFLLKKGVETAVHYPIPIHLQKSYKKILKKKIKLPVTEKAVKEILSLPLFNEMTNSQIKYVCETIKEFYDKS